MNPCASRVDTCERRCSRVNTTIPKAIAALDELGQISDSEVKGRGGRCQEKVRGFFSIGSDRELWRFFWFIQVGHFGKERTWAHGQYQKERLLLEKTHWKLL